MQVPPSTRQQASVQKYRQRFEGEYGGGGETEIKGEKKCSPPKQVLSRCSRFEITPQTEINRPCTCRE